MTMADDCLACGAPSGYPPAGPCRNHGTAQAILIEAGPTADGGFWITAKGDLLKEVWTETPPNGQETGRDNA